MYDFQRLKFREYRVVDRYDDDRLLLILMAKSAGVNATEFGKLPRRKTLALIAKFAKTIMEPEDLIIDQYDGTATIGDVQVNYDRVTTEDTIKSTGSASTQVFKAVQKALGLKTLEEVLDLDLGVGLAVATLVGGTGSDVDEAAG